MTVALLEPTMTGVLPSEPGDFRRQSTQYRAALPAFGSNYRCATRLDRVVSILPNHAPNDRSFASIRILIELAESV